MRRVQSVIAREARARGVPLVLSPVVDIVRDPRWGRVEETIGEDPYLIGRLATAYVRGLESTGIVATLKHFAGYSASRAGRNLAPVSMGPREFADVILPPFEMAIRLGGARSVMHAYTDLDGVPTASDPALLSDLLRDEWGFTGTVVADYFGIEYDPDPRPDDPISVTRREFNLLCVELEAAGVPLKPDRDQAWLDYAGWRVNYDTVLIALCALVMAPPAIWSSDRAVPHKMRIKARRSPVRR